MAIATLVTFRGTESSPALRAHVVEHARRLERFADDIRSCRVVVGQAGDRFDVHAHLLMRGRTIEAASLPSSTTRNDDAYVAVTEAFDVLRRRVEDYVRRRRGDVKARA